MANESIRINVTRDDFATGLLRGGLGSDHLIHHRDLSIGGHSGTGLVGFAGDDTLEASVPDGGQIHMYAGPGNDHLILDVRKVPNAIGHQGHHAYGGPGKNTFEFVNVAQNLSPIVGRIDDFDPSSDRIVVEGNEINVYELPKTIKLSGGAEVEVRIIEVEHPEFQAENLGLQYFLSIGQDIFYSLEGARDLKNGLNGQTGEERHFVLKSAIDEFRTAPSASFENPKNFVPRDFYEHREADLQLNFAPAGGIVHASTGTISGALLFGGKQNFESDSSKGAQKIYGGDGGDVINGNTGNNTIHGGAGNDLIAGGVDNDLIFGGEGDDLLWGGDGNDTLYGDYGDDYLHGGRGDDYLHGGEGNDTLDGGRGNNTLTGGSGDGYVNRFHFSGDDGFNVITDFRVALDKITFEDKFDPLSIEIYEGDSGNTTINYGEYGSVELIDVALEDFKIYAEKRLDIGDPIITISPSPERETLHQIRLENELSEEGFEPLEIVGVLYGADAFTAPDPGGYTYLTDAELSEDDADDTQGLEEPIPSLVRRDDSPGEFDEEEVPEDDESNDISAQRGGDGSCFVATAAFKDPWHPDVVFLRAFRDQWLVKKSFGRRFVRLYWLVGPVLAKPVRQHAMLSILSRLLIKQIVFFVRLAWSR